MNHRGPRSAPGRWSVALGLVAVVLAGCTSAGSGPDGSPSAAPAAASKPAAATVEPAVDLAVLGAASLKDVLAAVKAAYETATPGVTITIATDSSATLRTQIEEGAPADVFLSADQKNPEALVGGGLADGQAIDFATNRLTVIVPVGNPAGIATPADLATAGVKVIAAGPDVPITRYADEAVDNLAAEPGYPAGFADAYAANVVSREDNVKVVVGKIELGEGDAAIVYATDARASNQVTTVDIPADANVVAAYAGIVVKTSTHPQAAHGFLDWLAGPAGAAILRGFGFISAS